MAQLYEAIDERLQAFIAEQPMFFVATAPSAGGHVNVSPKGYQDTFSVIDATTVAPSTCTAAVRRPSPTCGTTGGSPSCSARSPGSRRS